MIGDLIGEWIKGILIDGIMGNLSGLFNTVNTKVGEIASDVGSTPPVSYTHLDVYKRQIRKRLVYTPFPLRYHTAKQQFHKAAKRCKPVTIYSNDGQA